MGQHLLSLFPQLNSMVPCKRNVSLIIHWNYIYTSILLVRETIMFFSYLYGSKVFKTTCAISVLSECDVFNVLPLLLLQSCFHIIVKFTPCNI